MFTLKQIQEIAARLAELAVKDSQFEEINFPLNSSESVPILQDGANRRIPFAEFVNIIVGNDDTHLNIPCSLSVTCNTPGATILIGGQTRENNSYTGHYGEVVNVQVSKTGFDTYYESVTLTNNCTLSITLNLVGKDYDSDITELQEEVEELISSIPTVSLVSKGSYYTLTVGNTSVDFYSKSQIDAILAGQGSGDATPDDTTEAFLNFSKNTLTLSAEGTQNKEVSIMSNIPWKITAGEVPDREADEQTEGAGTGNADNLNVQNLRLVVGQNYQAQEK